MTINSKSLSKKIPRVKLPPHQRFDVETFCSDIPISVLDKGIRFNIAPVPVENHTRLYDTIKKTYPKCSWVDLATDRSYLDISFQSVDPETFLDQPLNFDDHIIQPTAIISNRHKLSLILFSDLPDKLTPTNIQRILSKSISRMGKLVKFTLFEFEETGVIAPLAAAVIQLTFSSFKTPKAQLKILRKRIPFPIVFKGEIEYCAACNKLGHSYCGFVKSMSLLWDFWVPFNGTESLDSTTSLTITDPTVLSDKDFRTIQGQITKHGGLPLKEFLIIRKFLNIQVDQIAYKKHLAENPHIIENEADPDLTGSLKKAKSSKKTKKRKELPTGTTDTELPNKVAKPATTNEDNPTSGALPSEGTKQPKEPKLPKKIKEPKQPKQTKEPKQSKAPKQPKQPKVPKQLKQPKEVNQPEEPKQLEEPKQPIQSDPTDASNKLLKKRGRPSKKSNQPDSTVTPSVEKSQNMQAPPLNLSQTQISPSVEKSQNMQALPLNLSQTQISPSGEKPKEVQVSSTMNFSQLSLPLNLSQIHIPPTVVSQSLSALLSPQRAPSVSPTYQKDDTPKVSTATSSHTFTFQDYSYLPKKSTPPVSDNTKATDKETYQTSVSAPPSNVLSINTANTTKTNETVYPTEPLSNLYQMPDNFRMGSVAIEPSSPVRDSFNNQTNYYGVESNIGSEYVPNQLHSPNPQESSYMNRSNYNHEYTQEPSSQFYPPESQYQNPAYEPTSSYAPDFNQLPNQNPRELYGPDQLYNQSFIHGQSQLNSNFRLNQPQVQDYTNLNPSSLYPNPDSYVAPQGYSNLNYPYHQSVPPQSYHLPYNNQGMNSRSLSNDKYPVQFPNSNQPPPQPSETPGGTVPNYTHPVNFSIPNSLNPLYSNSDSNSVYQ